MLLYLSVVLVVPVLYGIFLKNEHRDRIILAIVCSLMLALLALRKPFSDVLAYMNSYNALKGVSFSRIIKDFHFIKGGTILSWEWGYSFICWIFANMRLPFQMFLVIESAFCVFCVYNFIDKNSLNASLSIMLIVGLGVFDYMFIIIRQTMALGFLLLSFEYLKKRNIPVFIIFVILATMMHRTAIMFIVVLPLSYIPVKRPIVAIVGIASLLIIPLYPLLYRLVLERLMTVFSKQGYISGSEFEFRELILLIIAIAAFLMVFYDPNKELEDKDKTAFWAFMVALPLQAIACYIPILGRVSTMMYLPFAAVAVPNLLETNENKKLVRVFEILIGIAALAYYVFCLYYDKRELELIPYKMFFMN